MTANVQIEEHDCYGNPFLLNFKDAVKFKIQYVLSSNADPDVLFEKLLNGEYKDFLEDAEIEIFLYPTRKTLAKASEIFQALTEITAIMAFVSGGVTMFGFHFEVKGENVEIEQVFV